MLLSRALEFVLSPGAVRVKGEHLLQVLEHIIKESSAKGLLLKPSLSVHSLPMGLEVAVKVPLLVGLILGVVLVGVKVLLVLLLLTKMVKVFEDVVEVEVEGLEVVVEVVVASTPCSSSTSTALPWRWAMPKLVVLSPPLVVR